MRIVGHNRVEGVGAQHVKNAIDFGLDRGASGLTGNKTHFSDCGSAPETSHARDSAIASFNGHANPAVQNKQHGVGPLARSSDDLKCADLDTFATLRKFGGVVLIAEDSDEPALQIAIVLFVSAMPDDNLVLTPFQRVVEFRHHQDVAG